MLTLYMYACILTSKTDFYFILPNRLLRIPPDFEQTVHQLIQVKQQQAGFVE